jgi:hypothetical protein
MAAVITESCEFGDNAAADRISHRGGPDTGGWRPKSEVGGGGCCVTVRTPLWCPTRKLSNLSNATPAPPHNSPFSAHPPSYIRLRHHPHPSENHSDINKSPQWSKPVSARAHPSSPSHPDGQAHAARCGRPRKCGAASGIEHYCGPIGQRGSVQSTVYKVLCTKLSFTVQPIWGPLGHDIYGGLLTDMQSPSFVETPTSREP